MGIIASQRLTSGFLSRASWTSAPLATAVMVADLAKRLELPTPRRSIAQPLDADASRQAARDGGADQLGSKEGKMVMLT
jgi:hypothetical protein